MEWFLLVGVICLFYQVTAIDRLSDQVAGCAGWQVIVRKLKFVPFFDIFSFVYNL